MRLYWGLRRSPLHNITMIVLVTVTRIAVGTTMTDITNGGDMHMVEPSSGMTDTAGENCITRSDGWSVSAALHNPRRHLQTLSRLLNLFALKLAGRKYQRSI